MTMPKGKDLREVDTSQHPQEVIIRSIQRTFLADAWASYCEENHIRCCPGGCDIMDYLPNICPPYDRESYRQAAVLYGRIYGKWGCEPWLAIHNMSTTESDRLKDFVDWGHYAAMEAMGSGVAWSDDHDPVKWNGEELPRVGNLNIYEDSFQWDKIPQQANSR